jgi:hypothetical protein
MTYPSCTIFLRWVGVFDVPTYSCINLVNSYLAQWSFLQFECWISGRVCGNGFDYERLIDLY